MESNKFILFAVAATAFSMVYAMETMNTDMSSEIKAKEAQMYYINKKLLLENSVFMKIHEVGTNVGLMEAKIEDIILKATAPMKKMLDLPNESNKNMIMCLDKYKIRDITLKTKADTRNCMNDAVTEIRATYNSTMKQLRDKRDQLEQEFADNAYNSTYMAERRRVALLDGIKLLDAAMPKKDFVIEIRACTKKNLDIFNAEIEKMMIDFKLCSKGSN